MLDILKRRARDERGFTLIELLVVITILGILAAVVVFSVGGVGDKGDESACKTDYATIQTAEEAYFARFGNYTSEAILAGAAATAGGESAKFLSTQSKLHNVAVAADGSSYTVNADGEGADAKCRPYVPTS